MRIHLGHHFYGAGNLGDDFMLAGFLAAMRELAPDASFTCSVPFPLLPLQQRFPAITWLPYEEAQRRQSIGACDVWLGLGGSPFQSALSRWFVDHLAEDATLCRQAGKPMFYLGIGVQTTAELAVPEVHELCRQAAGIWTRDTASAIRLSGLQGQGLVAAAADLAHVYFRTSTPPPAGMGRVTTVFNFDYGTWPGLSAALTAVTALGGHDHVWLAQESRELPGAERALYGALPASEQSRWRLVSPDRAGALLHDVLAAWPSGEWLLTSRYHAALAGAWSQSRVVIIPTNEKLRGAAEELGAPLLPLDADADTATRILLSAPRQAPPRNLAQRAWDACAAFLRSAVAHRR